MSEKNNKNIVPFCRDCFRDLELQSRVDNTETFLCRNCKYWVTHIIDTDTWIYDKYDGENK